MIGCPHAYLVHCSLGSVGSSTVRKTSAAHRGENHGRGLGGLGLESLSQATPEA